MGPEDWNQNIIDRWHNATLFPKPACISLKKTLSSTLILVDCALGLAENDQNSPKSQKHSTSVEFQCKIEF